MAGGFDLDWLPSTHTNNKRAIFRPGEEEDEEEEEEGKRCHLGKSRKLWAKAGRSPSRNKHTPVTLFLFPLERES